MTTKETLKDMVMQFKVAELQGLLEFAGVRNVKFRKKDLQKKAILLISKKRTTVLANKIRAIHANKNNINNYNNYSNHFDCLPYQQNQRVKNLNYNSYFQNKSVLPPNYCNNVSNNASENNSFIWMFERLDMQRINNIKFKSFGFFEYLSDIILVTPLVPKQKNDDLFQFYLSFTLNNETKRYLFYDNETESQYQAILRICPLNDEVEVCDSLPPKLTITLNHKFCSLPLSVPANKTQDSSTKTVGLPINITSFLEKNSLNNLMISWTADYYSLYGMVIQLVRKCDGEELITKLKNKGEQDPGISKTIIYNNLNDQDTEIAATSLKMSLICPLGKMLMSLPTRGSTCNHLQCFDGSFYIKMNEIKSTWQCPICNQTCLYENLFIDGYFMNILRSDKFTPNVTDIQLNADGSWESVVQNKSKRVECSTHEIDRKPTMLEEDKKKIVEKPSEPKYDLPPLLNESIVDDLKRFFFQYDSPDIPDVSTNKPSFSTLPEFGKVSEENYFDIKSINNSELPNLSSNSNEDHLLAKKNIILVDLTESDSDSDEIRSISSFSDNSNSFMCVKNLYYNNSPPVYDIDSDDS